MSRPAHDTRSWQLADAACNEQLSHDKRAELAELLAGDPAAAQLYTDYCLLHTDLRLAQLSDRALESTRAAIFLEAESGERKSEEEATPIVSPRRRDWLSRHITRKSIVVALFTTAAALVVMATLQMPPLVADKHRPAENKQPADADHQDQAIATMTVARHVAWSKLDRLWGRQPRIKAGQKLAFDSGLVEITYDTGARVVIEGPAEYTVGDSGVRKAEGGKRPDDSPRTPHQLANSGFLAHGKLVARVEGAAANGFEVETPAGSIKDLGTEFALHVLPTGDARLHVFEGKVEVHGEGPTETLLAGGSLTLGVMGKVVSRGDVLADQFVRTIPVRRNVRVLIDEDFTSGYSEGSRWISSAPGEVVDSAWTWSSPNKGVSAIQPETWLGQQGAARRGLATTYDHDRNPNSLAAPIPGGLEVMSQFALTGSEPVTMQVSSKVRLPADLDSARDGVLSLYVANRLTANQGGSNPCVRIFNLTDHREILPQHSLGPFGAGKDTSWNFRSLTFTLAASDAGDLIEIQFQDTVNHDSLGNVSARGLELADLRLDVGVKYPQAKAVATAAESNHTEGHGR